MKERLSWTFAILVRVVSDLSLFYMFYFLHFQKQGDGDVHDAVFNAFLFIE